MPVTQTTGQVLFYIDFSQEANLVENGYNGFLAWHEVASTFIPQTFTSGDLKITLTVKWPGGTTNTAMQLIDRGAASGQQMNNLLRDWTGTDGRAAQVPMDLIISGLPKGKYEWLSWHHDNADQTGLFNVSVIDAAGKRTHKNIDISNGILQPEEVTTFRTTLNSDGSEITLTFAQDAWPSNNTSFFVMNGCAISNADTTALPGEFTLLAPLDNQKNLAVTTELKWTASLKAEAFQVYLGTDPDPAFLKTTTQTSLSTGNLQPGTIYYWKVVAVNPSGSMESPVRQFSTRQNGTPDFWGEMNLAFSHERNYYNEPFELTITTNHPSANIVYTTDGSMPSLQNGKIAHDKIKIGTTTILKTLAISDKDTSSLYTHSYLFADSTARQPVSPPGFPKVWGGSSSIPADYEMDPSVTDHPDYAALIRESFLSIPSLSLSMDVDQWFNPSTGLYVGYPNSNISREKPVQAEFIFPGTGKSFAVSCGVQNQGGTSIVTWKVPKQSMRLLFKEQYGPAKLSYKLFPDSDIESINTLVVDAFLYGWVHPFDDIQRNTSLFFRDQLCSDLQNKMGWLSFHGIYVHLYINGLYWGMYDLHERPDDAFLAAYLPGAREDFDVIKHNPDDIVSGTNTSYHDLLRTARGGFRTPQSLKYIAAHLDLPAFIDYMLLNFYLGNYDWAHQNYYAGVNREDQSGFRFYTWDAEHVMRYSDVNYNNTLKNDKGGPTEIHTLLRENEEYRMMFADAVYKHCFNEGALTPESFKESFLYRKNEIDRAVILESARWGDYLEGTTGKTYTRNKHWLPEVEKVLSEYIPKRRDIVINQLRNTSNRLFPNVMPPVLSMDTILDGTVKISRIKVTLLNPNLADGDIYFTVDGSDPRMAGGGIKGSKYSGSLDLYKNTLFKARFKSRSTGEWSALASEMFLFDNNTAEQLVISEIMYHPEDDFPEFIEIMNNGENPVFLRGISFSKGISFTFREDDVLQPGKGLVLTNDTALFYQMYRYRVFGQYRNRLDNETDTVILRNGFNLVLDSVSYNRLAPWPTIPGDGYSIELTDLQADNSKGESWKVNSKKHGTPILTESDQPLQAGVFPNPFHDFVEIQLEEQDLAFERFSLQVFDRHGGRVFSGEAESYNSTMKINLVSLSAGMYFIRLEPVNRNYAAITVRAIKIK